VRVTSANASRSNTSCGLPLDRGDHVVRAGDRVGPGDLGIGGDRLQSSLHRTTLRLKQNVCTHHGRHLTQVPSTLLDPGIRQGSQAPDGHQRASSGCTLGFNASGPKIRENPAANPGGSGHPARPYHAAAAAPRTLTATLGRSPIFARKPGSTPNVGRRPAIDSRVRPPWTGSSRLEGGRSPGSCLDRRRP